MVRGLDLFRERFREYEGAFVLIGGAACHEWLAGFGAEFRPTKDLDIVLIVEVVGPPFVAALRSLINEGKYEIKERTEGTPVLYRFTKPENPEFPFMLEFFSRKPDEINLGEGQEIVPVPAGTDHHSLSAILMDDGYYALIREHRVIRDGLPFADATALIPLKARASADLSKRRDAGEHIDSKNITKHERRVPPRRNPSRGTRSRTSRRHSFRLKRVPWLLPGRLLRLGKHPAFIEKYDLRRPHTCRIALSHPDLFPLLTEAGDVSRYYPQSTPHAGALHFW
jgi:hypothetical protein